MHGKKTQKNYQHSPESTGLMRFVATMRHITDEHEEKTLTVRRRAAIEARATSSQQTGAAEFVNQLPAIASTASEPVLGKRKRDSAQR